MKILSFNPGHDGAIVDITEGHLKFSIEAEKDSNYRYSPISGPDLLKAIGEIEDAPNIICIGGWWPRDHHEFLHGSSRNAGYRGTAVSEEKAQSYHLVRVFNFPDKPRFFTLSGSLSETLKLEPTSYRARV